MIVFLAKKNCRATLNFEVLRFIVEYLTLLNRYAKKRIEYVVCTNCISLSQEQLAFYKRHDVSVSTSVDGPPEIHDVNRFCSLPNSKSIFHNIQILQESNDGISWQIAKHRSHSSHSSHASHSSHSSHKSGASYSYTPSPSYTTTSNPVTSKPASNAAKFVEKKSLVLYGAMVNGSSNKVSNSWKRLESLLSQDFNIVSQLKVDPLVLAGKAGMEIVKQLVADAYIAGTIAFQNGSYSTLIDVGTVKGPLVQIKKSAIDLDVLLTSIQNELKRQLDLI